MDTLQASTENCSEQNAAEPLNQPITMTRIEAMVTPEQVRSASVAKKRRTFTKKRNAGSRALRDKTPVRELSAINNDGDDITVTTTEEDEDQAEPPRRPKTPERKRRRKPPKHTTTTATVSSKSDNNYNSGDDNNEIDESRTSEVDCRSNGIASAATQPDALVAFFNRTRKSIAAAASRSRDKFRKVDKARVKRSQSAPHTFTEEELIESFRKAQLLDDDNNAAPKSRKLSDTSLGSLAVTEPIVPKAFRPEVREFVRQRRKQKYTTNNKIIEILDPHTSTVIATRTLVKSRFTFKELIMALRRLTLREICTTYKLFKVDMKMECDRIRVLRNRCISNFLLIVIFCGLGGMMFKFVEGTFEYFYKCGVKRVKRDFIDMLWMKSHSLREDDWKSLARTKLRSFEEELHAAHEAGIKTYSGQRSWSFINGVVYCFSIVTKIGYGHIFPDTVTGKALTIVYAIIGIPLFLIALTDFGKLFTRCIKFFWSFVRRVYYTGNCRRARKTAHVQDLFKGAQMMYEIATFRRPSMFAADVENPEPSEDGTQPVGDDTPTTPAISNFEIDDEFNLPISLAIFILILYLLLGALMHCLFERWLFHDAFYFVFISMSTIGFGDMVIDNKYTMIISFVYLVFGLTLTSMCINVVQAKLSDTVKQASDKIGATIGFQVEEDGSVVTVAPDAVEMPETHEPLDNNKGAIEDNMVAAPVPSSNNSSVKEPEE